MSLNEKACNICQKLTNAVLDSVSKVVVGKEIVAKKMLICLLSGGHVLLEDVPGIGKTTIVHALASSVKLDFKRIQFTPDLMPSDVTGFNIYNPKNSDFEFREGAVNTQILLADEINRSSPRTQSALLEAMQEGQVTVEGETYKLPQPFMVMATQNPVENVGTYPLPEAQLDRFMMRLSIGYPSLEEEMEIINSNALKQIDYKVKAVAEEDVILWLREQIPEVDASDSIKYYILGICRSSRENPNLDLGVSPRASQMLLTAAKAQALMSGRSYVIPEDVTSLVHDVLDHRIILKARSQGKGISSYQVMEEILQSMVVPK